MVKKKHSATVLAAEWLSGRVCSYRQMPTQNASTSTMRIQLSEYALASVKLVRTHVARLLPETTGHAVRIFGYGQPKASTSVIRLQLFLELCMTTLILVVVMSGNVKTRMAFSLPVTLPFGTVTQPEPSQY